jgi:uncharacterized protein YjbJ (UPF0337 family)
MNADLFRGQWNAFKGELKKEWAKFTDDDLKKIDGEHDRFLVIVLDRYPGRREEVSRWADDWYSSVELPVGQPAEPG